MTLEYRSLKGYKFQVTGEYLRHTPILPPHDIQTPFIDLAMNGNLCIAKGYAWNGANGPTKDTADTIEGTLVHDAFYQLMQSGYLGSVNKVAVDLLFHRILRENGMSKFRAAYWRWAVLHFGKAHR